MALGAADENAGQDVNGLLMGAQFLVLFTILCVQYISNKIIKLPSFQSHSDPALDFFAQA